MNRPLKAFHVSDSEIFVADSLDEAARLHFENCGEPCEDDYPDELSDAELDREYPEYDEDERPTGNKTTIRKMLVEHGDEPGLLCCIEW